MRKPGKCEFCGCETSRTSEKRCRPCAARQWQSKKEAAIVPCVDEKFRALVEVAKWHIGSGGYVFGKPVPKGGKWTLHHYVWFLAYGYKPKMLDHINRDKTDNRLENLRLATRSLNTRNTADRFRENGLPRGVEIAKRQYGLSKPYAARCSRHGRQHNLGYYATAEEAGEVARNAREIIEEFEIAESEDLARAG